MSRASWTKANSNFFIFPIGLVTESPLSAVQLPVPSRQQRLHPLLLGEDFLGHAYPREDFAHGAGPIEGWLGWRIHNATKIIEMKGKSNSGDNQQTPVAEPMTSSYCAYAGKLDSEGDRSVSFALTVSNAITVMAIIK